jgi:CDP-Glycerol:Poly(glycerophosphate) glycerophosphotransferase
VTIPQLNGKGLFVFSDPGGAKPVLALAESLQEKLSWYKVISDREYNFYSNFSVQVQQGVISASEELKISSPDFILTGTSYTSSIELEFIKAARALSIPSYAFVDHWTSIRERFSLAGEEILPDKILVIDEQAKQIAVQQGLEEKRILIFGNPYHRFLEKWTPAVSKEFFLRSLALEDAGKKIILYAPDPLSNVNGINAFGFNEVTATAALKDAVNNQLDKGYLFVCNPHPNQKIELLKPFEDQSMIITPAGTDLNSLIFYADAVVGFFSNILLEAQVMKKPVLRFFIRKGMKDPFEKMDVGKIVYPETIVQELKAL